jgi:deazaflavin-dependent oxidoreductase (nitroreductase family)
MFFQECDRLEAQWYGGLNRVIEPLALAGFGSPTALWPGLILVETTGRKTGRTLTMPLLAVQLGDALLVSTVRRKSQWIKNLAAHPEVRYWKDGRRHDATAWVFASDGTTSQSARLSPQFTWLITMMRPYSRRYGGGAALLIPRRPQNEERSS